MKVKCTLGICKFNDKKYLSESDYGNCLKKVIRHRLNGCEDYCFRNKKQAIDWKRKEAEKR